MNESKAVGFVKRYAEDLHEIPMWKKRPIESLQFEFDE